MKRFLSATGFRALGRTLLLCGWLPAGAAQNGYWNVDADGDWETPANWADGFAADGSDATAAFTLAVTGERTVTLSTPRTVGHLLFADGGAAGHRWIIQGETLTLDGAAPKLTTVTDAIITARLSGDQGLVKAGNGLLTLAGPVACSGDTIVEAGTLRWNNGAAALPRPLGYWPISEGSGTNIYNAAGAGAPGTLVNAPAWVEGPGGPGTYAVQFNGVSQWGVIPTAGDPLHALGADTLSVSAWVKTTLTGGWYRSVVTKFANGSTVPFWGLGWRNQSQLGFVVRTGDGNQTAAHTGATAIDGTWHHLLGVREADNTLRIYLDGNLYSSVAGPAGSCANPLNLGIAFHGNLGTSCVAASIAGIGVWQEALTPEQVRAVYGSVLPMGTALRVAAGAAVELAEVRQTIGSLADHAGGGGSVILDDAELTVGRDDSVTTFSGSVTGEGALFKTGTGTLTLDGGTVNVSGGVTVQAGTFALANLAVLGPVCTNIVVEGGTLALSHSDALPETATVSIQGAGEVELAGDVNQVVSLLLLNGARQPAGTYGSAASAAQFKNDDLFAGTGVLRIVAAGTLFLLL